MIRDLYSMTRVFLLLSAFPCSVWAQQTQTVKGRVIDQSSEKGLPYVSVGVVGAGIGTQTDSAGNYRLSGVPVGRQQIAFEYMGFHPVVIPEVLVTSGKQVVLDVSMQEDLNELDGVTVTAGRTRKGAASDEFAGISSRSFSMEEVTRYPGGRNDPARLASNFAGVSTTDDSRNDIVVRGNSPSAVLWRLEGIPVPNPNHFATLGTTGGPVSAINTNALKNSDFYTGAFSAEYGNVNGAVFDLRLREGNREQFEKTVQLNLTSGLEAMLEGPLGKGSKSSFLVGYRYSVARIGQSLGFNIGTSAPPEYQDLVLNINFAPSSLGRFSLFGMGGTGNVDFIGTDLEPDDFFANQDEDLYFTSSFGVLGLKHELDVGEQSYLRSVLSYSYTRNQGETWEYLSSPSDRRMYLEQTTREPGWRFSSYLNSKVGPRLTLRGGLQAEWLGLDTYQIDRENREDWRYIRDYDDQAWLLQPFVQGRVRFTDKLSLNLGVHGIYYGLNDTYNIEPRGSLSYAVSDRQTLTFSYGLHSQLQPLPVYLFQEQLPDGSYDRSNRELDLTKAHHYILGTEWRFAPDWRLKGEVYYQYLYDVPVEREPSGFSILNAGADFTFPEKTGLVNEGTGINVGAELTIEKFFSRGYYLLGTASVFDARYKGSDGIERNSTFNNRTVFNVLAGRELKTGKEGRNAFTIDLKSAFSGGRYYTPVDLEASLAADTEVLDENRYNELRLSDYFRLDIRFGFRLNSKNRNLSHTIYLDLQNVTNNENIFTQRFNTARREVGTVNQLGFFPDLMYRIQF